MRGWLVIAGALSPGFGTGNVMTVPAANVIDTAFLANVSGLQAGIHTLYVRVKDDEDNWGITYNRPFLIEDPLPASRQITRIEYFWGSDPGYGSGTALTAFIPGTVVDDTFTLNYPNPAPPDTFFIRVKDNMGYWSITNRDTVKSPTISGVVRTVNHYPIPNVTMNLTGTAAQTTYTNINGYYNFRVTKCGDYTVTPFKNNDSIPPPCGITTQDILLIRRHILAIEYLDSPYKIIAAGLASSAGDASVSTSDILSIRRVVLGIRNTFSNPAGRLWTFVSSDFVFQDSLHPFPYDDFRSYSNLISSQDSQNFIGIRIGDVNNSCIPSYKTNAVGKVQFSADEYNSLSGAELTIPVKAKDFKNITGYQFTLSWNPEVLELLGVNNKSLSGYYGTQKASEGFLTTAWDNEMVKGVSLNDDETVFELKFKVIGENGSFSEIKIGSEMTASEAYNENLDLLEIKPVNGMVKVGDNAGANRFHPSQGWNLSVVPNPFTNSTQIIFELPKDETVTISIYDVTGREVWRTAGTYSAGRNSVEWEGDDGSGNRLSSGLYQVRMTAGNDFYGIKASLIR